MVYLKEDYEKIVEAAKEYKGLKLIYEGIEYIIDEIIISSYVNSHECWCKDKEGNKLRIGIEYDYENVRFKILDYTLYK